MWNFVIDHFKEFLGTGLIFVYYLACVIRLFISEKRKEYRILFIYMPAVVLLLFFNPFVAQLMREYADDDTYYRILWLLPVSVTIAFSVTDLFSKLKGKVRVAVLALSVLLIVVGGKLIYTDTEYSVAENEYHMPQEVVDICDAIVIPGREIMVAFPTKMVVYVRQYSPLVVMPYGFEDIKYRKHADDLRAQVEAEQPDAELLFNEANADACHYVILDEEKEIIGNPEDYGYYEYSHIDGYVLYRSMNADFSIN